LLSTRALRRISHRSPSENRALIGECVERYGLRVRPARRTPKAAAVATDQL